MEHAESHRAKYRSILPARQAGPSSAASARRVMEMWHVSLIDADNYGRRRSEWWLLLEPEPK